jgi:hypothetical protein
MINVDIYDSPGLFDDKHKNEEYLKSIQQIKFDLLLYCSPMNDPRVRQEDELTIEAISNIFQEQNLWDKAVIVLTFANLVKDPKGKANEVCCIMCRSNHLRTFFSID